MYSTVFFISLHFTSLLLIRKASYLSPPKCFYPSHIVPCLHSLSSSSYPSPNPNPSPIQKFSSSTSPAFPISNNQIAHDLLDVFSRPPKLRTDEELRNLGRNLTPEAVETVVKDLDGWRRANGFFCWASRQDGYRHNCYTYNAMASVLCRACQKGLLKALTMEMVNQRCPMTPGALGFLIRCLGNQGLVEEANYVFSQAGKMNCVPNAYTYNCLLEALAKLGQSDSVEMRLREMVGLGMEPDKYTLTPVLKAYCCARKFEDALRIFNKIHDKGWVDGHVFTVLAVSFCKWGEVDRTWDLIQRMGDLKMRLNDKTFYVLIHGFVRERRVDRAIEMFEKMKELGFSGDLALYSVLIEGLCEGKDLKKALNLYSEMKNNGVVPDVQLITMIISKLCGDGDLSSANWILEEDGEKLDLDSLVLLYNAVLEGLVSHGEVERAHSLLQVMINSQGSEAEQYKVDECSFGDLEPVFGMPFSIKKAVHPNSDSFRIVVCGLCKAQKLDMALELINDMIEIGCMGKLSIYNNMIHELCNVGRLCESFELLRKMKDFGFEPTQFTHNSLFGCLCKREDLSSALDLLREMRHLGHVPWIKHCTMLVQQLCEHGKVEEACSFLDEMVHVGFLPDMIAYSAAIDGLCRKGNMDRALKLFREVSTSWFNPDVVAHNILINGFCKAGRVVEARDTLIEMLDKGLVPSVVTYNLMMDGWFKADKLDMALLYFSKMVNEVKQPTVVTYTTLINGLFCAGRPDDALVYWNEMREKGCAPNKIAYIALVHGLCKCGREDAALVYFREMEDMELEPDTYIYIMMLNTLILKGSPLSAIKFLKGMVQKANFSCLSGKNYQLLKNAVCKLHEDVSTSSDVKKLIEEGAIPMIRSVPITGDGIKKL